MLQNAQRMPRLWKLSMVLVTSEKCNLVQIQLLYIVLKSKYVHPEYSAAINYSTLCEKVLGKG